MKRHYMTNQQKTPQINSLHALAGAPRGEPKEQIMIAQDTIEH